MISLCFAEKKRCSPLFCHESSAVRSNPQRRRENQIAQSVRTRDYLGRGASAVSALYPRAATAGLSSKRGSCLLALGSPTLLLCLCGTSRTALSPARNSGRRHWLLVCVPHQRGPHAQTLSGIVGRSDPRSFRAGGQAPQHLPRHRLRFVPRWLHRHHQSKV